MSDKIKSYLAMFLITFLTYIPSFLISFLLVIKNTFNLGCTGWNDSCRAEEIIHIVFLAMIINLIASLVITTVLKKKVKVFVLILNLAVIAVAYITLKIFGFL